jgi:hypothetical protein
MIKMVSFILLALAVASPHLVSGETTVIYAIPVESVKDLQNATEKTESDLVISEITFKLKSPGKEMVWIQGNRSFAPSAFAIEGDKPRFVIDIKDTGPVRREFIEGIRTFYDRQNRTLRIVLDLQPSKSYRISQFFYQGDNIYAVEVEAK